CFFIILSFTAPPPYYIYTLSLHDALPILEVIGRVNGVERQRARASDMVFPIPVLLSYISGVMTLEPGDLVATGTPAGVGPLLPGDRKSTRLNSSHDQISYAVFCLKKKKIK